MQLSLKYIEFVNCKLLCLLPGRKDFFFPVVHFRHLIFFSVNIETPRNSSPSLAWDASYR